jgi:hypothetical protein
MRAFRPYEMDAASALRVSGELYPLVFVTDDALSHLGVVASFGTAVALDSEDARGTRFSTTMYDLALGVRYRLPLAPDLPDIGIALGWTRQVFVVRASETQALGGVPDLIYDALRVGVSARFALFWRLSLRLDGGFGWVLSTGELQNTFLPYLSSLAFDGNVAIALRIVRGLEARVGFDLRAYLHSANREEGDRYAVTGASDLFYAGTFGLAWRN